jgi:hypothetical protein
MKTILHNRISETSYNVELAIETDAYVVTYGKQREVYENTPQGLMRALQEYIECVYHAETCEGLHDD